MEEGIQGSFVMTVNIKAKEVKFFNNLCGCTFILGVKLMSLRVILELHLKEVKVSEEEGGVVKGVVGGLPLLPFPGVKEKCFFFSRWMPGESERRGE